MYVEKYMSGINATNPFEDLLQEFADAKITKLNVEDNLVSIEYELLEEKKQLFTTPNCLLASVTSVLPLFKNPLESQSDFHTSHKTLS